MPEFQVYIDPVHQSQVVVQQPPVQPPVRRRRPLKDITNIMRV